MRNEELGMDVRRIKFVGRRRLYMLQQALSMDW